jgi:plasmid maintenance system antidote protein VapI
VENSKTVRLATYFHIMKEALREMEKKYEVKENENTNDHICIQCVAQNVHFGK